MGECLSNIIVKDIKGILPLRLKLLKLYISNRKLFKDRKAHLNTTTTLGTHASITRTKSIGSNIIYLVICLQNLLIGFLVFRGYISKII